MKHQPVGGLLCVLCAGLLLGFQGLAAESGSVLVPAGSVWKYLDTGANLSNTSWRWLSYDDSAWPSGNAPLGYGESFVATTVSYGSDPDNKHITTYLRQTFNVPDASAINRLFLRVLRDDGVVVYLNGTEVFRNNMPLGTISYRTFATTNVYGGGEQTYYSASFPSSLLTGDNVLAVELHQAGADSLDLDFDLELTGSNLLALTRGPYLQMGTPSNLIVRWRTDQPSGSRVQYGTNVGSLNLLTENAASTTEHEAHLYSLEPNTKYYYSIGSSSQNLAGGPEYFFITGPNNHKPTRIWVTGDTRTGDIYQAAVRDAYYQYAGSRYTDLWLMLGDDGGPTGSDEEFSECLFGFFPEMLRQTVLWPCIGNHETYCCVDMPYLRIFSLPADGDAGGVASGSERYYSFNYGNIHFVVLDTVTSDISVAGAQYSWLQADLEATSSDWLIAYFHYPPYSKGSHDSDWEYGMIEVRENFVPLLESYGVDLVMSGHSHVYERSYLLDSFYGYSWELASENIKDAGSGRPDGSGAYVKSPGLHPHEGTVYVVAGSSGLISGGSLDHPAMFVSENQMGSLVLDIDGNTLQAAFLRDTGAIDDYFSIIKGTPPEIIRISQVAVLEGSVRLVWNSVSGKYYQVERKENLSSNWVPITNNILAVDTTSSWTDDSPPQSNAFYRIVGLSN